MSAPFLLLVGLVYAVFIGGLSLLKREPLSAQFALETMLVTGLVSGLSALTGSKVDPVIFVIVLYLVTMRVRLLVDLGNIFAQRKKFNISGWLYTLALKLWPDQTGRVIVRLNQGTSAIQQNMLEEAIDIFKDLLQISSQGPIGVKYEAAIHYNLGIAYHRKQMDAQAVAELNLVADTWPMSESARRASTTLKAIRHLNQPPKTGEDMPGE